MKHSEYLKDFIRQIENQLNQKVKTIRCDNGTEFKNKDVIEFCGSKGIKREYSNARTPQQNGVAERKNRTLIKAARTMLADSFLPNTFWAEAVSTACYVLNRVLVTKPHNKTPYELLTGKIPIISYIRPFGCHVTILNTIDHLGKFAGKSDEGFLVGYSLQSKAFRVYNLETKRVEENLHITFLENKPNVAGKGPTWLFDLDYLTDSMNYHLVSSENQANLHAGQQEANQNAGTEETIDVGDSDKDDVSAQDCFLELWPVLMWDYPLSIPTNPEEDDSEIPPLEDIYQHSTEGIFTTSSYDDEGAVADFTNLETVVNFKQEANSQKFGAPAFVSYVQSKGDHNHKDFQHCLFACFRAQHEPKKISEALKDESWVDAMQEELMATEEVPKGKPKLVFGNLECLHLTLESYSNWTKLSQSLQEITTGGSNLVEDTFLGNAKKRQTICANFLLQKQSIARLQAPIKPKIQLLKAQITKLKKQAKPIIKHHRTWLKSVSLKQRFPSKSFSKKHRVHKESVSKQVEKGPAKQKAQGRGRTREMVEEDKEIDEIRLSTEDVVSTDKEVVSTDKEKVSTDEHIKGTKEHKECTEEHNEGAKAQREGTEEKVESTDGQRKAKSISREKEKGVELKDIEEADRPRPTSTRLLLTLKPLPKIDPKNKGRRRLKEEMNLIWYSLTEKKFKQLKVMKREDRRKIQRIEEGEEERKR
ncbi:putative ribonuclease H-like domain-containing protein [Tanacetum coccineum]